MTKDYSACPPPLLPAEVVLRDFEFMKLNVSQLLHSKLATMCIAHPRVGASGVFLWATIWHQAPAASIEDDDDVLAEAARCPPSEWAMVKGLVLRGVIEGGVPRGWVLCSDGRWWHSVIAAQAWECWLIKLGWQHDKAYARAKKSAQRQNSTFSRAEFITLEQWISHNYPQTYTRLVHRNSQGFAERPQVSAECPEGHLHLSLGTAQNVPGDNCEKRRDFALREEKRREEYIRPQNVPGDNTGTFGDRPKRSRTAKAPKQPVAAPPEFEAFLAAYRPPRTFSPARATASWVRLVAAGTDPHVLIAAAQLYAKDRGDMVQDPTRFLDETWKNFATDASRIVEAKRRSQAECATALTAWGTYGQPIIGIIGEAKFSAWFRNSSIVNGGGDVTVFVKSSLQRERMEGEFRAALETVFGKSFAVSIIQPQIGNTEER